MKLHILRIGSGLTVWGLFIQILASPVNAAELRGRVTDADTGASLSGSLITVDPDITSAGNEITTLSDPFGFYYLKDLVAGTNQVTASYPGHAPEMVEKTVSDAELLMEDFALEPLVAGQTLITVFGQVVDTKSSFELRDVPVRIRRFLSEGAAAPVETLVQMTDKLGMVEFRGLPAGWYDFRFNGNESDTQKARPFWEDMTIGKKFLGTTHSANARLMPIGQNVTFHPD